ncbi:FKBP-type peptidyl-prolyl cis-trans isomerase [Paraglaciecola aquimarina]|uniref:Peptidyl-prolyl cis-trans isomerase n=1 Tax=Paraglaciecola aquimarina TaxID=1235557 RepID=A0ABU3SUP6_9ALTE|nr:FKBP-type peptidyl-prolyl cis-trans isomerase [Paraglaciecola aquimarina]MDU0353717.1 FKBP-type peptidyl-prolyl cis-trans isomerase [Paraglaciecola aquimarina]
MSKSRKLNKGSAGQNRKASELFIEKYLRKEDAVETPSGLIYRVVEETQGLKPRMQDSVVVNQRILHTDGSVIADTYKTGFADRFSMQEALPGLQEGLQFMAVGARYEFVLPLELALGKKGVGNKIGPNAALFFDIRLLEVDIN